MKGIIVCALLRFFCLLGCSVSLTFLRVVLLWNDKMEGLFWSEPKPCSPGPLKLSNDISLEHEYTDSDAIVERKMKWLFLLGNFSLLFFLIVSVFVYS